MMVDQPLRVGVIGLGVGHIVDQTQSCDALGVKQGKVNCLIVNDRLSY